MIYMMNQHRLHSCSDSLNHHLISSFRPYAVMSLQEASISVWLQFSDDTASLLSSFSDLPYFLHLSSLAETVVMVTPGPSQRVFAQGDGGGPLLRAELLVSTCAEQPIMSNSIGEGNRDWMDARGGRTRRLARGSGWIRVNLDLGFLSKSDEGREFEFDMTDTLMETDSDIYVSNFNNEESGNVSSDYYGRIDRKLTHQSWNEVENRGMVHRNNLERAVLMPSQEEGTGYFSTSQEKKGKRMEEEEGQGARELEVGLGAVLSLLCLFAVLFLANFLPCALRDRRRATEEQEGEVEVNGKEAEAEERMKTGGKDKKQQREDSVEGIKDVEIIC